MHNPTPVTKTSKYQGRRFRAFEPTALLAGLGSGFSGMPPALPASFRSRIDVAGPWERHVNGKLLDVVPVPSSQHPLGFYRLKREFLLPALSDRQRAILHFDAIAYHGRVFVNDRELGTTIPYVPFDFEFTKQAMEGRNRIEVAIADLRPDPTGAGKDEIALGVNPGWEAYGGIIRDVYVEVRAAAYIENVQFGYRLSEGYRKASCWARVFLSSSVAAGGHLEVVLWKGESEVARAEKGVEIGAGASEAEVGRGRAKRR